MTPAECAVAAARGAVGARFRSHGRDPAFGLDCVGLAVLAARAAGFAAPISADYAVRSGDPSTAIDAVGLVRTSAPATGDLLLFAAGPAQFHLAVQVPGGIIHADAMLRRVVERPGVPPWPLVAAWRLRGD
ncbi:peptidoglycan endopeptidase [Sphingomonas sp. H39-1-10]|uniref:peptidoglycan endopeptidase n=1 Tax=Sphingomonas pollutisoli TaxID=3030829 RepID=UPI0023B90026|nr:peptidoglycan endopeptidase [Sphingomonas pollutisoli]MDF0486779.1 peptidoglycan endopeptidase [Sphingomonas pollutisoli]